MNLKKLLLISILLIFLVGAVSAEENTTTESADAPNEKIANCEGNAAIPIEEDADTEENHLGQSDEPSSPTVTFPNLLLVNKTYDLIFDAGNNSSGDLIITGFINATFKLNNGSAIIPITCADEGDYYLNVNYGDFDWQQPVEVSGGIEISMYSLDEIHPWSWADSDGDSGPGIDIDIYNRFDEIRPAGNASIYLNGEFIDNITWKSNSYAHYLISENILWQKYTKKGKYKVNVIYPGDDNFKQVNASDKFYLSSYTCEIDRGIVYVQLPSDVSGVLTVKANGKTYTKKIKATYRSYISFADELYAVELEVLKHGTNTFKVNFKGNSKICDFTETLNYKNSCLVEIVGNKYMTMHYSDSKTLSLKIYNKNEKPVGKNQLVKIKISKKTFTAKTNKNGAVKFKIPNTITPGKYKISMTYKNSRADGRLTVKHVMALKTAKVKKSAQKLTLKATLKKGKTPLKGKKITFKFNGKTYKVNTDKKGIAKVTVTKSMLKNLKAGKKVTYSATYLKDTVKKTVKVRR